ncbi:hypothetical protein AFM12_17830 [Jiulongibacter sediminis]|uniref:Uncharacterized protein n=1 Tax=Jiulongibacter sediminis TaxID=1605367 RepID=A0A0P7BY99_9BACT|nr:hypothetical protein AFM12_17830 [Jiulongibacter sediminis]TBX22422.1 hypothetical protein TK44_17835 [Jiulongibacter sediminis]
MVRYYIYIYAIRIPKRPFCPYVTLKNDLISYLSERVLCKALYINHLNQLPHKKKHPKLTFRILIWLPHLAELKRNADLIEFYLTYFETTLIFK